MTTNPQTVTQICSYLEISPTTFDRARRFVNGSKTHDDLVSIGGDGKRGKAKQYDLGAAREALRLYSEQVRTNAESRAGKPKRIGREKRDFSAGNGRKPVVLKDVEPDDEPEPADGYTPPVISTKYKDGTDPTVYKSGGFVERMAELSDQRHIEESPARKRRKNGRF